MLPPLPPKPIGQPIGLRSITSFPIQGGLRAAFVVSGAR